MPQSETSRSSAKCKKNKGVPKYGDSGAYFFRRVTDTACTTVSWNSETLEPTSSRRVTDTACTTVSWNSETLEPTSSGGWLTQPVPPWAEIQRLWSLLLQEGDWHNLDHRELKFRDSGAYFFRRVTDTACTTVSWNSVTLEPTSSRGHSLYHRELKFRDYGAYFFKGVDWHSLCHREPKYRGSAHSGTSCGNPLWRRLLPGVYILI